LQHATLHPRLRNRLHSERHILATLDHPSIARLIDSGDLEDGTPYLVMEHVDGESIDSYCDSRTLFRERLNSLQVAPGNTRMQPGRASTSSLQHLHGRRRAQLLISACEAAGAGKPVAPLPVTGCKSASDAKTPHRTGLGPSHHDRHGHLRSAQPQTAGDRPFPLSAAELRPAATCETFAGMIRLALARL
jgi:serine/threonine protein kinase